MSYSYESTTLVAGNRKLVLSCVLIVPSKLSDTATMHPGAAHSLVLHGTTTVACLIWSKQEVLSQYATNNVTLKHVDEDPRS